MLLVNQTQQTVYYAITAPNAADCGEIAVNGVVDLQYYNDKENVTVTFSPVGGGAFFTSIDHTKVDEQLTMLVKYV